jgi:hypothetical protein
MSMAVVTERSAAALSPDFRIATAATVDPVVSLFVFDVELSVALYAGQKQSQPNAAAHSKIELPMPAPNVWTVKFVVTLSIVAPLVLSKSHAKRS